MLSGGIRKWKELAVVAPHADSRRNQGERLLAYARRILSLTEEACDVLTGLAQQGAIRPSRKISRRTACPSFSRALRGHARP